MKERKKYPVLKKNQIKELPFECQCCSAHNSCYIREYDPACMNFNKKVKEDLKNENKV